jgi:hypothetical protein
VLLLANLKGQASVEVLIAVSILLIILAFAFNTYIERKREVDWSEEFLDAKSECYKTSSLISRVRANGKNFLEIATFIDYKISIYGDLRSIGVFWDSGSTYCTFSTVNVTNITHSRFDVFGEYRIFNDGTNVVFEKT